MLDRTKPITTRDGREVRILADDLPGMYPIAYVVKDADFILRATAEGLSIPGRQLDSDLINPKKEVYVIFSNSKVQDSNVYDTALEKIYPDETQLKLSYSGEDLVDISIIQTEKRTPKKKEEENEPPAIATDETSGRGIGDSTDIPEDESVRTRGNLPDGN